MCERVCIRIRSSRHIKHVSHATKSNKMSESAINCIRVAFMHKNLNKLIDLLSGSRTHYVYIYNTNTLYIQSNKLALQCTKEVSTMRILVRDGCLRVCAPSNVLVSFALVRAPRFRILQIRKSVVFSVLWNRWILISLSLYRFQFSIFERCALNRHWMVSDHHHHHHQHTWSLSSKLFVSLNKFNKKSFSFLRLSIYTNYHWNPLTSAIMPIAVHQLERKM